MNLSEFKRRIKENGCPVCHNPCEFTGHADSIYQPVWRCVNPQCLENCSWHTKYDDLDRIERERWW